MSACAYLRTRAQIPPGAGLSWWDQIWAGPLAGNFLMRLIISFVITRKLEEDEKVQIGSFCCLRAYVERVSGISGRGASRR